MGSHTGRLGRSHGKNRLCAAHPSGADSVMTKISGKQKSHTCALWSGTSFIRRVTPMARARMTFSAKMARPI